MKKNLALRLGLGLVLLFAILLLTACAKDGGNSGNSGGDSNSSSTKVTRAVIKPSQLISREDAGNIIGQSMTDDKIDSVEDEGPGSMRTVYISDEYIFQIAVEQDALLNAETDKLYIQNGGVAGAIERLTDARETNHFEQDIIPVEGIGDGGYLVDQNGLGVWSIELYKGDYLITMTITYNPPTEHTRGEEEEVAWRKEKLHEAGKLAVERLDSIVV